MRFLRSIDPISLKAYAIAIAISASIAMLIRAYVVEAFKIPTSIMRPALEPGDTIFALKYPYRLLAMNPKHAEIVIYQDPQSSEQYIKRVVAGPGDRVRVTKGRLFLNGSEIPFERDGSGFCGIERHPRGSYRVCLDPPVYTMEEEELLQEGHYYVLGDSRTVLNSKKAGEEISVDNLRARAAWIWLSVAPPSTEPGAPGGFFNRFRTGRFFQAIH